MEASSVGNVVATGVVSGEGNSLPAPPETTMEPAEQANAPAVGGDDAPGGGNASGLGGVPSPGRAVAEGADRSTVAPPSSP